MQRLISPSATADGQELPLLHIQVRRGRKRVGREWTVTVKGFSTDQVEFIGGKNSVTNVEVEDLTLDQVFRDYVRQPTDSPEPAPT
jgi:hypothetical protein